MKEILVKVAMMLAVLIGIGGFVCATILAIGAKAWFPLFAILVLGGMAVPTFKRFIGKLTE